MGDSSGVFLAIFFTAAGGLSANGQESRLKAGLRRIQEVNDAKLVYRTMIDALEPALEALSLGVEQDAMAARRGANVTATILGARAGSASYVSGTNLIRHNDPGGEDVARLF